MKNDLGMKSYQAVEVKVTIETLLTETNVSIP